MRFDLAACTRACIQFAPSVLTIYFSGIYQCVTFLHFPAGECAACACVSVAVIYAAVFVHADIRTTNLTPTHRHTRISANLYLHFDIEWIHMRVLLVVVLFFSRLLPWFSSLGIFLILINSFENIKYFILVGIKSQ